MKNSQGKKHLKRVHKAFSDDSSTNLTGLLHLDVHDNIAAIGDPGRTGPQGPRQGGILIFHAKNGKWRRKHVVYDPQGQSYDYFGEGVSLTKTHLVGGTDDIFFQIVGTEVGLTFPPVVLNPLKANKAVVFKKVD